ncbi:MAG TPA: SRPBCC family protein [Candidatus Limnocylindrales bacterium]|nr:SRPBCC family protein [Candidatus Limnocylindrales bacterium]
MKPVELSVVINRPLEECFAYLADLSNDLEWRREWIEAEKTTNGPHGVGARYRLTGTLLGRRINTVYETIAYEPNRQAAWTAVSGPLPLNFSRAFEAVEGGTRVTMRYWGDGGFLKLGGPLVAGIGRRQYEGDFPKLKAILETQPAAGA